jgi:hypothetical protein
MFIGLGKVIRGIQGEFYGHTAAGNELGPFETRDEVECALAEVERARQRKMVKSASSVGFLNLQTGRITH